MHPSLLYLLFYFVRGKYIFENLENAIKFTMPRILPLRVGVRDSLILILLVLFNTVHITDMANNNMDIPNKEKKGVKSSVDKPPGATENEEYIRKCGHYFGLEPVQCSSLNYPCITCDMSIDCRYGASYNYTCTVNPKIVCDGPKQFNRTAMCRFCYQTEKWEHRCDQKANCNSLASPMKFYTSNCTASDNVLCLGKRRFLKKIKCSWTAGTKWLTAMILAITLGGFGADRFYLGHWQEGIGKLFSFGGLGVWTLVDALLIGIHHLGPADGSLYL